MFVDYAGPGWDWPQGQSVVATGNGSVAAGFVGVLTGQGGGVVMVRMLVLLFGVEIRYEAGAPLVSR
jgi:uncharacterized membrane protein YfcA